MFFCRNPVELLKEWFIDLFFFKFLRLYNKKPFSNLDTCKKNLDFALSLATLKNPQRLIRFESHTLHHTSYGRCIIKNGN